MSDVPGPVALVAGLFAGYDGWWALGGGWAVDAWLGGVKRRDHGDVDVCVFGQEQGELYRLTQAWNLVVHDEKTVGHPAEQWDGRRIEGPAHIHARPPGDRDRELLVGWVTPPFRAAGDGQDVEIVVNERDGGEWLLAGVPRVGLAAGQCAREAPWGVPVVVPEVLAFFKATAYWGAAGHPREVDAEDFRALLPLLGTRERGWLRDAIGAVVPRHPWLGWFA